MIGVGEIRRLIPHRYPALLVDRVSEVTPGQRLVAHKAITVREPCYARINDTADIGATVYGVDFAYPTSLLLESWAQAAVLLARWDQPNPDVVTGNVELLGGVRDVELLEPVLPGYVVDHVVELVRATADATLLTGRSSVDGRAVLRVGRFTVAARGIEVLRSDSTTRGDHVH